MTTDYFGPRRLEPLHAPEAQTRAAEDTATNNTMQQDEAAGDPVQAHAVASPEDYTISVDQVREHFRSKGLTKSKDTVQRWCRTGDLDCQKRGVLGRYFTTETSLLTLEQKLLPDMIAENAGLRAAVSSGVQLDTAAPEAQNGSVQVHAPAEQPARSDMQPDEVHPTFGHAAARSEIPEQSAAVQPHAAEELAALRAECAGLKEQLTEAKENAKFLREEVISARGQRGDVVKIAEQMLGTLETIAVGGRLERPREQGRPAEPFAETVRYAPEQGRADGV